MNERAIERFVVCDINKLKRLCKGVRYREFHAEKQQNDLIQMKKNSKMYSSVLDGNDEHRTYGGTFISS